MAVKTDNKATRLDLRIPNDIYAQIEAIATANNEPSHHTTGKIILTPTIVKLISLGISQLSGDYSKLTDMANINGQVSDSLLARIDAIEGELESLKKLLSVD